MGVNSIFALRHSIFAAGCIVGALVAVPAAAVTPRSICRIASATEPSGNAAAINRASALAEAAIEHRRDGTANVGNLDLLIIPDSSPEIVPASALARYCVAAGELMRIDPAGNQVEAKQFLVAAVNLAHRAGDAAIEARAAYFLGLTLLSGDGPAGTNTRGAAKATPAAPRYRERR